MVQQSLGVTCALMDLRRAEAPSGIMAASMVGPMRGFLQFITLEMGWRKVVEVTSGECT
jgi:hypothetical protein